MVMVMALVMVKNKGSNPHSGFFLGHMQGEGGKDNIAHQNLGIHPNPTQASSHP
jgi:hypothetical protein